MSKSIILISIENYHHRINQLTSKRIQFQIIHIVINCDPKIKITPSYVKSLYLHKYLLYMY